MREAGDPGGPVCEFFSQFSLALELDTVQGVETQKAD